MGLSMHDRYYEPEDDNDGDWISERTADLLNTEYDISQDFRLFAEGISECSDADRDAVLTILAGENLEINFEHLGRKLWDIAFSYAESIAEKVAIDQLNSGYRD